MDEFPGVDTDGGNAHAGAHDGDGLAVKSAGKPQHIAHTVELDGIFQEVLGDELRPQWVTGQEDGFRNGRALRIDVWGGNIGSGHICAPRYGVGGSYRPSLNPQDPESMAVFAAGQQLWRASVHPVHAWRRPFFPHPQSTCCRTAAGAR